MSHRTRITALALTAGAATALAIGPGAGSAGAETHVRHYSGYDAEWACNADKAAYGHVPGAVVLCDELNNGRYRLSVVPHGEIPLHLLGLMATGSFDGLS
ncbi:hypothetical protein [Nocardia flavorosea]|uniref:Secreted protein n=1 Tax=Nocardia flavorosea TaxID=53429 RepID=A0A846YID2_9NOCA|nr:hypothetical protein [Nocardia flavorosea]NKY57430.1 hypothetical protein [Nocardia flavorosea]